MNIVVIGLGSMGKRRIRLLKRHFPHITVFGIDADMERARFCQMEYGIETFLSLAHAKQQIEVDCAFICTPPLTHSGIITECLEDDVHVFTELNLIKSGYEKNIKIAEEKKKLLFLSSTALYRKEMKYIIDQVHGTAKRLCYSYHVGQYLPDWHPWENYKDAFFSNNESNGCREILAIELPWILKAFGKVRDIHVVTSRMTDLNIGFDDLYSIQLVHDNGNIGNLIVDVVCREAVRKLEVFGEDLYLEWKGKPDSLVKKNIQSSQLDTISLYTEIDRMDGYSNTIIENQYLDEIKTFFRILDGREKAIYDFVDDLETLNIIDRIEGIVQ